MWVNVERFKRRRKRNEKRGEKVFHHAGEVWNGGRSASRLTASNYGERRE
ncbi:Protein CBG27723 [Caenorhabditis briggsae]|uniref:Protein CBG27723 n=1 Tax=Caenorhabditis briggsae TaxID=6238 RepID=B6IJ21_CAEBR|nr:Protein CBG27723 [Caenorhabditis briggsae]CAS00001.1 Protein CBG27723 [Caenorhabditis briggsae]